MNKAQIVAQIAAEENLSEHHMARIFDSALGKIGAALQRGDEVRLAHFGTFSAVKVDEHPGRNPRTGETITIAAHTKAKFKPSRALLG